MRTGILIKSLNITLLFKPLRYFERDGKNFLIAEFVVRFRSNSGVKIFFSAEKSTLRALSLLGAKNLYMHELIPDKEQRNTSVVRYSSSRSMLSKTKKTSR